MCALIKIGFEIHLNPEQISDKEAGYSMEKIETFKILALPETQWV